MTKDEVIKKFSENGKASRFDANPEVREKAIRNSVESRRQKKLLRESMQSTIDMLLKKSIKEGAQIDPEDILSLAETEGKNISVQQAIVLAQVQKALLGDVDAAKFIRDTLGEKPAEKIEAQMSIEDYVKTHKVRF